MESRAVMNRKRGPMKAMKAKLRPNNCHRQGESAA